MTLIRSYIVNIKSQTNSCWHLPKEEARTTPLARKLMRKVSWDAEALVDSCPERKLSTQFATHSDAPEVAMSTL
jgi:hypothetical protein